MAKHNQVDTKRFFGEKKRHEFEIPNRGVKLGGPADMARSGRTHGLPRLSPNVSQSE
jgi:hypothetical protein